MNTRFSLHSGVTLPSVGFGVYEMLRGDETENAVSYALNTGYRLVDTARIYGNENDVGRAIAKSRYARREIFVTSKLWNKDHGYDATLLACERSLKQLGLEQLDLYLVHWPVPGRRLETWKAMEKLLSNGKCRAIGVSNYTIRHLEELLGHCEIPPAVNQVEFNPFLYQRKLLEFCKDAGIQLQAYSPLARGQRMSDMQLRNIARKYGKTPGQIMLRWSLQKEVAVIPKSVRIERIRENFDIYDFEISPEDMLALDRLHEGLRTCWDPTGVD